MSASCVCLLVLLLGGFGLVWVLGGGGGGDVMRKIPLFITDGKGELNRKSTCLQTTPKLCQHHVNRNQMEEKTAIKHCLDHMISNACYH